MTFLMPRMFLCGVVVAFGCEHVCRADAESLVLEKLELAGLETGYDEDLHRFVVMGTAEKHIETLSTSSLYDKTRNDLGKIAALNARRELMYMLALQVRAKDSVNARYTRNGSLAEIRMVIEHFASMRLSGCKTLCSAESYDRNTGAYQVAVAIGWSRKVALAAINTCASDWVRIDDEAVYEAWCKKNDLSAMIGSRDFTDDKGVRRYVGIGASDIDGLRGVSLSMAIKKSAMKAKDNLVMSLAVDSAAHDVAQRFIREFSNGGIEGRDLWERFSVEVFARCNMELRNHKVIDVDSPIVTNPATGRKMYVSVVGITAASSGSCGALQ